MPNYEHDDWLRLGRAVYSARNSAGLRDTKVWASKVGRSTRMLLGLERGEPVGRGTLDAIEKALGWPLGRSHEVLADIKPTLDRSETPNEVVSRGNDASTLGDQSAEAESAPLSTVRFRRPDGIGDEEWIEMRNRLGGYWEALLDAAAKER